MVPSRVSEVLWSNTLKDINTKLKLKVGYEQAQVTQFFQTISQVISHAFGGKKKTTAKPPATFEEAERQFKALFGK